MDEDLFRICFSWYKLIKKYLKPSEQDEAFDALREYLENGVDPVYRVRKSLRFPMALIIDQIVALREGSAILHHSASRSRGDQLLRGA